jgi:hypothetical protein
MSSRNMCLLSQATLHSDSEQLCTPIWCYTTKTTCGVFPTKIFHIFCTRANLKVLGGIYTSCCEYTVALGLINFP